MSQADFVTIEAITVRLGEQLLFPNASFRIRVGEHWGIVGPNGSGKSVLTAALSGQLPLAAGKISYHFLSADEAPNARFGVFPRGAVARVSADDYRAIAERYGEYCQARWHASELVAPGHTVADLCTRESVESKNRFEVLPPAEDSDAFEQRREEVLTAFGLAPLLDRNVGQLSHGEVRKLVMARAMMRAPRLLVLDDPFAGLDARSRRSLCASLDALAKSGVQLVLATAREDELPSCVRHVARVDGRRLAGFGARAPGPSARAAQSEATSRREPPRVAPPTPPTPAVSSAALPARLELRDVTVRYGDTVILDRVTFRVAPGEHWALFGPNGSGKTTLLSLILGDNPQVYANDVDVLGWRPGGGRSIWETRARLGWVSPELHAHTPGNLSVTDVVCSGFFGSIGLFASPSERQVAEGRALASELLPGDLERAFGELSYGAARLVLIARALVSDPELLLLDEPCHGLDEASRVRVLAAVDGAARRLRASIVFITHHPEELPECITHVLELERGRVVRAGPRTG